MDKTAKINISFNERISELLDTAHYLQIIFAEKERKGEIADIDLSAMLWIYTPIRKALQEAGHDPGKLDSIWQSKKQPKSLIDL